MSEPLLKVNGLKTQFFTEAGTIRAVDGVSFEIYPGEIVGLVGESGAGKSVAGRSVLRLVDDPGEIVDGKIRLNSRSIVDFTDGPDGEPVPSEEMLSDEEIRKEIRGNEIAIIFQDPMESLNPVYTVGSQLTRFIKLNRDLPAEKARKEAIEMLRDVGIPKAESRFDQYPHQFSGGMRQRVLIAMALACEPSLIIADEPTTALDVTVEGQILNMVNELQDQYETAFLWITHDLGVVAEICDRVNVMYLGEIVEEAHVDDLFFETQHPYTQALLESIPHPEKTEKELNPISGIMPEAINPPAGCRFHSRCPDARDVCREVNPDALAVRTDSEERAHRAACLKHEDVFKCGYPDSSPIDTQEKGGFDVGRTEGEADE
jgi:peptide/nickel transport system ATP-binding protein